MIANVTLGQWGVNEQVAKPEGRAEQLAAVETILRQHAGLRHRDAVVSIYDGFDDKQEHKLFEFLDPTGGQAAFTEPVSPPVAEVANDPA